ncbi:unnamed protein product [Orchesella dallaii]|uniref:DOMON domain-containing protein n=1 Tax=Orchesella dallaii TaxID=48710 RepID=A0ABP1Q337_9HEXA
MRFFTNDFEACEVCERIKNLGVITIFATLHKNLMSLNIPVQFLFVEAARNEIPLPPQHIYFKQFVKMGRLKYKATLLLIIQATIFTQVHSQFASIFNNSRFSLPLPTQSLSSTLEPEPQLQYSRREVLNEALGYVVEWEVDRTTSTVVFNITGPNLNNNDGSYFGFGLSRTGQAEGADVVIAGIGPDGQLFLLDTHGVDNNTLVQDANQDWQLLSSQPSVEAEGLMMIRISRQFDTCDEQDIVMNNDLTYILWGYGNSTEPINDGASESVSIPFTSQGNVRAYLLDPVVNTTNTQDLQTWRVSRQFRIPSRHTSYWCTIHRGNRFASKQHIVGYGPYFGNELSRKHVHHQLVYRCIPPPGLDASIYFDKFVGHPGEECYLEEEHQLPTNLCLEVIAMWGLGGKEFQFPDSVGFPLGEAANEYFMFETHYDNPEVRDDLLVENGMEFLYTEQLRPTDGSMVFFGTSPLGLFMIPPQSQSFNVSGTCSSQCTKSMIPLGGMDVIGMVLHAHTTTHQVRFKHFRDNKELPWILNDDNYDYGFQQFRALPEPVKVLPGDVLATECMMSTIDKNMTTLAGFSTRDEMCLSFVIVNRDLPFIYCISEYPTDKTMSRYGIGNMTWDRESQERIITGASDPSIVGQKFSEFVEENVDWTPEAREEVEREQFYDVHDVYCPQIKQYAAIYYASLLTQRITGGVFNLDLNNARPSTRSVRTSGQANSRAAFPDGLTYAPPDICEAPTSRK